MDHRQRNEAFLQRHWRVFAPLLAALVLAIFIVPWLIWQSFVTILAVQIGCAGLLFVLGKLYTTAFAPPAEDDTEDHEPEA